MTKEQYILLASLLEMAEEECHHWDASMMPRDLSVIEDAHSAIYYYSFLRFYCTDPNNRESRIREAGEHSKDVAMVRESLEKGNHG